MIFIMMLTSKERGTIMNRKLDIVKEKEHINSKFHACSGVNVYYGQVKCPFVSATSCRLLRSSVYQNGS